MGGLFFMLLLGSTGAHAATYVICVNYTLSLLDADTGVGDDYLTTNDDVPARGARIIVKEYSGGAVVKSAFADTTGTNAGCITGVDVSYGTAYVIRLESRASVGGNTVEAMNNDVDENLFAQMWNWTPFVGEATTKTMTTSMGDQWNILASGAQAALQETGGAGELTGETWRWYLEDCPSGSPACIHLTGGSPSWVMVDCLSPSCSGSDKPARHKYQLTHQMGHLASIFANGDAIADIDASATTSGSCTGGTGHHINTIENQSQAAFEGFADMWAAQAFNASGTGADCHFAYFAGAVNWDMTLGTDLTNFNCDGTLCPAPPCTTAVDGNDYEGDVCGAEAGLATEIDWLRFWWDMRTDHALSDADLLATWVAATPDTWNAVSVFPGGTPDNANPPQRLRAAAVSVGVSGSVGDAETASDTGNGTGR